MKVFIIVILFYVPAAVVALNAHTLSDWGQSIFVFFIGVLLSFALLDPENPKVKRWTNLF